MEIDLCNIKISYLQYDNENAYKSNIIYGKERLQSQICGMIIRF